MLCDHERPRALRLFEFEQIDVDDQVDEVRDGAFLVFTIAPIRAADEWAVCFFRRQTELSSD